MRVPRTWRRSLAILGGAVVLLGSAGVGAVGAETAPTETQTIDLGDLDATGTGTFDAFDPSVGTLTQVDITADVTMNFAVCITNLSEEADSAPAGSATGAADISFPAGVVAEATGSIEVEETPLAPFDEGDDCSVWADDGVEPTSDDSLLTTDTDVSTFGESVTEEAGLAEFVGPGTVDFSFAASSDSSLGVPSGWTIVFLADGEGEVTITYTYDTEVPEVLGTSTEREALPRTGSDDQALWLAAAGGWMVVWGGALLMGSSRFRSARE